MLRPCTRTSLCKRRSIVAELVESSAQYSMAASQHCYSRACTASDHLCGRRFLRPSLFSHRLRHRIDPVIHASTAASTSSAGPAKSKLSQLAGRKYGHNLTESQKQDVRGVIKELEALQSGSVPQQNLAGTNWQLLYTESTGSSGGIVGPFVGQVDQAKCCCAGFARFAWSTKRGACTRLVPMRRCSWEVAVQVLVYMSTSCN